MYATTILMNYLDYQLQLLILYSKYVKLEA